MRSLLYLFLLLPGLAMGAATDTAFLQRDGSNRNVEVPIRGSSNTGKALGFDGSGILTTLSVQTLDSDLTSWAGITRASGFDTFATTPSSANLISLVTNETGTGALVFGTSPTLTTPVLGVATVTTINKVAFTAPATGSTLTILDGKTLTANHSITLAGTDSTVMTFPTTSATIARTDAAQTFTGTQTFGTIVTTTLGGAGGAITLDASGFNGNLATTDNTFQEVAQKLDDLASVGFDEAGNYEPTGIWDFTDATVTFGPLGSLTIPLGADPDIAEEGQLSWESDLDVLRAFDGTIQVAIARKFETFQITVIKPNDLDDAQRDAVIMFSNNSGMSFVITSWSAWSTSDDTTLNIEEVDGDGANNATVDAVEIATNGTGIFTGTDSTITADTIEDGHMVLLDFDDTDTPAQVHVTIKGYYLRN
jgi:hypothetical protein